MRGRLQVDTLHTQDVVVNGISFLQVLLCFQNEAPSQSSARASSTPERACPALSHSGLCRMTVWIVDAMNVIGSRPTGWWRDRRAAVHRLLGASQRFAAIAGDRVILVVDGRPGPDLPEGEHDGVRVVYAAQTPNAADDRIVELVASESTPTGVRVVTSDRALQERVHPLGAHVETARAWLRKIDAASPR